MVIVIDKRAIQVPPDVERDTLFEMVPVGLLFHDMAYSRGVSERQVERMGATFDMQAAGVLYVSYRSSGKYYVLDGCHRHAAAIAAGIEKLPCRVYIDLTLEEEAQLFTKFNRDRRPMKVGEVFRARLTAHEPRAVEIERIIRTCGLDLAFDGGGQPGKIQAISTIESIYATHGPVGLREVIDIARDAWGTKETRAYTQTTLGGIAAFWVRYRERMNRARFIDRLRLAGPTQLLAKSSAFRTVMLGVAPDQAFGRALLDVYNSGLRAQSRLPEWAARALGDVAKKTIPDARRKGVATRKAKRTAA